MPGADRQHAITGRAAHVSSHMESHTQKSTLEQHASHLQCWLVIHLGAVAREQHGTLAPLLDDAPLRAAAGAAQHRLHGCVWVTVPCDSSALLLHEYQALTICRSSQGVLEVWLWLVYSL